MLEAILLAAGRRAVAAGNVGRPLVEVVTAPDADGTPAYDALAVELSSFQLHWSSTLAPAGGRACSTSPTTTSTGTARFEAYRGRQGPHPAAGAGRGRRRRRPGGGRAGRPRTGARSTVTLGEPAPGQLGVRAGALVDRAFSADPAGEVLLATGALQVRGPHNTVNALAAAALARAVGVPAEAVGRGPGRLPRRGAPQRAGRHASTASTTSTTARPPTRTPPAPRWPPTRGWCGSPAVCSRAPTSTRWSPRSPPRLAGVVLLGRDRDADRRVAGATRPVGPVVTVVPSGDDGADGRDGRETEVMREVVAAAARLARPGDTVLLAPAAASMDVFTDYAHRGRAFADAVARAGLTR